MRCPKCGGLDDKVIDSRASKEGSVIRRRRECLGCSHRFTTYEEIEHEELFVVKRDGRRELFSKDKLLSSIKRACQKRPVPEQAIADAAERITDEITDKHDREVPSKDLGERVMRELRALDAVAYVRFASIYREFQEVGEFVEEIHRLATLPPPDKRQMALLPDGYEAPETKEKP
jgi:transcriptional repressor NrdR